MKNEMRKNISPVIFSSVATLLFIAGLSPLAAVAKQIDNTPENSKVGKSCKVTSGSNKGSSGTYTEDEYGNLWCEGDWGGTECSDGKDNQCTDASGGRPPIFEQPSLPDDQVSAPVDPPPSDKIPAPDDQVLAPDDPQKPDLIIDSMEVISDLVTRENGFTYVSMEVRIANAGSTKTTVPFKISSGYYDYQDDVGPSSYVVPDQVNQQIEAGGAITLLVDVAVPYPNGLESPFSINIELDSCSSNDANMDTTVCRIDEESEGNNSGEVTL